MTQAFQPSPPTGHELQNADEVPSPALLIYPDRISENVKRMLAQSCGPDRLRPHVKTHKLAEVVRIQQDAGIRKFKCATIAEAEMLGECKAEDILIALQPVGPNIGRVFRLIARFPDSHFSTIVDNAESVREIGAAAAAAGIELDLFVDIDCGMHRSGAAMSFAVDVTNAIIGTGSVKFAGLHVYDGHIHDADIDERAARCERDWHPVKELLQTLDHQGTPPNLIIAGGTPTFPIHAARQGVECSPGTCVFWDAGYATNIPDMDYQHAAFVLTRVISKPQPNLLCLDLGHKSISGENPITNRVRLLGIDDAKYISHSEEHLVIETRLADQFQIGAVIYGVPWHICPTVALYDEAVVVRDGEAAERWKIRARARVLSI